MRQSHRWIARGVAICAVIGVGVGIGMLGWPPTGGPQKQALEGEAEAAPAPAPSAAVSTPRSATSLLGFDAWAGLSPTPASELPAEAASAQALPPAGWCLHPPTESRAGGAAPQETLKDRETLLRDAKRQLRQRWGAQLRAQRDLRAQAFADYLDEAFGPPASPAAGTRAHLHDLARISTDPLVTVMALRRPCPGAPCRGIERTQWSRLEPQNSLAWLAAWDPGASEVGFRDYVLERIRTQSSRASGHLSVMTAMLLALPHEPPDGLGYAAETELLDEWGQQVLGLGDSIEPAAALCLGSPPSPGIAGICLQVADQIWQHGSPLERRLATSIGLERAAGDGREALWRLRRLEVEAVERVLRSRQAEFEQQLARVARHPCLVQSLHALEVRRRLWSDPWTRARREVRASGADLPAWIERWDAKLAGKPPGALTP